MKTNELIKEARRIKLKVLDYNDWSDIVFKLPGDDTVATVSKKEMYKFNNDYNSFEELDCYQQQKLFNLLTEYANTPIEEREEEKKYMYRVKEIGGIEYIEDYRYLNYDTEYNSWIICDKTNAKVETDTDKVFEVKHIFTHSELKSLGVDIEQLQEFYEEIEVTE